MRIFSKNEKVSTIRKIALFLRIDPVWLYVFLSMYVVISTGRKMSASSSIQVYVSIRLQISFAISTKRLVGPVLTCSSENVKNSIGFEGAEEQKQFFP